MFENVMTIAAGAGKPLFTNDAIEWVKNLVNQISPPQYSMPLFVLAFVLMMVYYRQWTKPKIFVVIMGLFTVAYFGSMAVDHNYYLVLAKADNVPITIMVFGTAICLWIGMREAALNDESLEAGRLLPGTGREDKVLVWPDLIYTEMICMVAATAALNIWAVLLRAPLEAPANPAGPPNPSKAPWYFLGLQEMLVYFDPWMAGVLLPGLIITGLIMLPYIDSNPKGNGYYTVKQRPFAITTWMFGFLILWVVLIVFGTFLRGPNWNFFGPYEFWDAHKSVPLTNINVSDVFWIFCIGEPLPSNPVLREVCGIIMVTLWCIALPVLLARTIMRRLFDQMGSIRFYIMAFHLVIMAMLPVKMVLRWLFNLKYFIYLPEWNLNL